MEKQYDHKRLEPKMQSFWEQKKIYAFEEQSEKPPFSIDTPPPTVSGNLHIGHIFSYTHTDLVARFKRMQGYNVFYPMGFDDNGLPTERFVEKKHNVRGHLMKRSDFVKLCLEESHLVAQTFKDLWCRIGLSVDWTKTYSTISDHTRAVSQQSFLELYKKHLAFKKEEPSLYCTTCKTSVAQAELEAHELSTLFTSFQCVTQNGEPLTIATTRPELLPACVALFFHPDDERYKHLAPTQAHIPLFNLTVPIIPDDRVEQEKGTGLVMCCTFGDQTDIYWFKKHRLPFKGIINRMGMFTNKAGFLEGLRTHDARKQILQKLDQEGLIADQKKITHSVMVHERCKQEIEYLILDQWFIKIIEHKDHFLKLADEIDWKPHFMKSRYLDWVSHLSWDWCISRQRFYGIPFPVWYCNSCHTILIAEEKDLPIDPQQTSYPGQICSECESTDIRPDTDVMDTWNTSSLTPLINGMPLPYSIRPQAHDIIRTWAFYTIVKSFYHTNTIPWKTIAISGHVLSGKEKISKSKGGAKLSPETLLEDYPADAIRYWASCAKPGTDTLFSEHQIKLGNRLLTKLWNAYRFLSPQIIGFAPSQERPQLDHLNAWLLHHFSETQKEYIFAFEHYSYHQSLEFVENFFWHKLCDSYIECVKDRLFHPEKYSPKILGCTRFVMYHVGLGVLQLFAPFIPFITDSIYQKVFAPSLNIPSLHSTTYQILSYQNEESISIFSTIQELIHKVRKIKTEEKLALNTPINELHIIIPDEKLRNALTAEQPLLSGITKAESITFNAQEDQARTRITHADGKIVVTVRS